MVWVGDASLKQTVFQETSWKVQDAKCKGFSVNNNQEAYTKHAIQTLSFDT